MAVATDLLVDSAVALTTNRPVRYARRTYGQTQISRFSHGLMLIRMVIFAFFRLKAL